MFCDNFPTLECLDFHTENTSTYTQNVFEKNIIIFCLKATFLLCYTILSNHEITKQYPTKGSSFHGIFVALLKYSWAPLIRSPMEKGKWFELTGVQINEVKISRKALQGD